MSANAKGAVFALLGFALFSAHDVAVKYLGGALFHLSDHLFFGSI
jgi:hypothetical protein